MIWSHFLAQANDPKLISAFGAGGGIGESIYRFVLTALFSVAVFWLVVRIMKEDPSDKGK